MFYLPIRIDTLLDGNKIMGKQALVLFWEIFCSMHSIKIAQFSVDLNAKSEEL